LESSEASRTAGVNWEELGGVEGLTNSFYGGGLGVEFGVCHDVIGSSRSSRICGKSGRSEYMLLQKIRGVLSMTKVETGGSFMTRVTSRDAILSY
jgi:hypothetical protein